MFETWFRVQTVALIGEVLWEVRAANKLDFVFSSYLSMGWHRKNF